MEYGGNDDGVIGDNDDNDMPVPNADEDEQVGGNELAFFSTLLVHIYFDYGSAVEDLIEINTFHICPLNLIL